MGHSRLSSLAVTSVSARRHGPVIVAIMGRGKASILGLRDRSHFGVPAGFDRFCPGRRQKALKYLHLPAPFFLDLHNIASNLERPITGAGPSSCPGPTSTASPLLHLPPARPD